MLQRVFSAYRRIAKSVRKTVAMRQSAPLYVVELEARAIPTVGQSIVLPIQPPVMLQVAVVNPPVASAVPANESVRSDLFGVGDGGKAEHPNELEEMLADKPVPQEVAVAVPKTDDGDVGASVIIEDMIYLPYVD